MVEHAVTPERSRVVVEMWSDLGCPWCYVGKHRLEAAVARRSDAERFEIAIRSFELDPTAPHEPEKVEAAYLRSHGGTADNFLRAEGRAQQMAHAEGLEFSFDRLSASTFDLHRVVQYAGDQGRGFAFFSRVQDGYFAGALNPFDEATLVGVATSVGLEADASPRSSRATSMPTGSAPTGRSAWNSA